jgi:hypothetical protein
MTSFAILNMWSLWPISLHCTYFRLRMKDMIPYMYCYRLAIEITIENENPTCAHYTKGWRGDH